MTPTPRDLAAAYHQLAGHYQNAARRENSPQFVQFAKSAAATARHVVGGGTIDHAAIAGIHKLRSLEYSDKDPNEPTDPALSAAHDDLARLHQAYDGGGEPLVLLSRIDGYPPVQPSWKPILDEIVGRYDPARWRDYVNAQPISEIPIDSLIGTQITVRGNELAKFVDDPELASKQPGHTSDAGFRDDVPIVLRVNGDNFLWDGNHRTAAAVIRGDKREPARVVPLPMPSDRRG